MVRIIVIRVESIEKGAVKQKLDEHFQPLVVNHSLNSQKETKILI